MLTSVMADIADCDIFIGCAAVADYKPMQTEANKIKKIDEKLTLTFIKNPDIIASIATLKQRPFTVGFAAETQHVESHAKEKLINKKLDMIAANDVSRSDIGFNGEENALTVYWQGVTYQKITNGRLR